MENTKKFSREYGQAASLKLQAASGKLPDSFSLIKFWHHASGIKN